MNAFGIFAKQPIAGTVKTRLAESIGPKPAAELYEAFIHDLVGRFDDVADQRILGYSPATEDARDWFRAVAGEQFKLWEQPEVDLGKRMECFFEAAFAAGAARCVLIGSDAPNLPKSIVEQALRSLTTAEVVLGPAVDGGYYLVGHAGRCHSIFDGIEWSSSTVLESTLDRIESLGHRVAILPPWYDVDTIDEAGLLKVHLRAAALAGQGGCAQTMAALDANLPAGTDEKFPLPF